MNDENILYYIIPICLIIYLIHNNQNNSFIETFINNENNQNKKLLNNDCQYKIQSYNDGYVLVDDNNKIIKQFNSKQQYINYAKFELKNNECIISDIANEYNDQKIDLLKQKEKELEKREINIKIQESKFKQQELQEQQQQRIIIEQQKNNNNNIEQNMKDNESYQIQMDLENIKKQNVKDNSKYAKCFRLHSECLNKNPQNKNTCNINKCLKPDNRILETYKKNEKDKNLYSYRGNWSVPQALPPICIPKKNKCQVCPQYLDKNTNKYLQISKPNDTTFENWAEGNKINTNFDIITTEWRKKNDPAEPQNFIPSLCPFDDCKPCEQVMNNKSEHPSVIIGQNLLPKFKYQEL